MSAIHKSQSVIEQRNKREADLRDAVMQMINNPAIKEFDHEELIDLFGRDLNLVDAPFGVCDKLANVIIGVELTRKQEAKAKRMFKRLAANIAEIVVEECF